MFYRSPEILNFRRWPFAGTEPAVVGWSLGIAIEILNNYYCYEKQFWANFGWRVSVVRIIIAYMEVKEKVRYCDLWKAYKRKGAGGSPNSRHTAHAATTKRAIIKVSFSIFATFIGHLFFWYGPRIQEAWALAFVNDLI